MHIIMHIMPRIAKPHNADLPRLRSALVAYLDGIGVSVNAFAKDRGVSQSTLQRFLSGRTKNVTQTIRPLLTYAGIRIDNCIGAGPHVAEPLGHSRIKQALEKVWDGSDESAAVLAQLIEAIGPLLHASKRKN